MLKRKQPLFLSPSADCVPGRRLLSPHCVHLIFAVYSIGQCTHYLNLYRARGKCVRQSNVSLLPRTNISISNTACIEIPSVLNSGCASTTGMLESCNVRVSLPQGNFSLVRLRWKHQALKKTPWLSQCTEAVIKDWLCPARSISGPLEWSSVSVGLEFWHSVRKSLGRLWGHSCSLKIAFNSPILALKSCATGDLPCVYRTFLSFKNHWPLGYHLQFQWTGLSSLTVSCQSGPP